MLPNITGGANWQGGSFDPETKMFYIFTNTSISSLGMVPGNPERNKDFAYIQGTARDPNAPPPAGRGGAAGAGAGWRRPAAAAAPDGGRGALPPAPSAAPAGGRGQAPAGGGGGGGEGGGGLSVQGLPLNKPPYGRITAIDMNKGELAWTDRARRHAGQHQESPGAEGAEHPADRTSGPHRRADDEDAGHRRRGRLRRRRPTAAARCCARTTRRQARMPAPSTCRRRRPDRR